MNKTYLIAIAAALMAAPMVLAHDPPGTYKNYCEPVGEWNVHEYGPPASGRLLQGYEDGNLGGDCSGATVVNPGTPCVGWEDPANPLTFFVGLCESELDLPAADYDGHAEYARGGAWILVTTGSGEASTDPSVGAGTLYCFGDEGHHIEFGNFEVVDAALETGATFTVASDTTDLTGTGEGCGDFQSDNATTFHAPAAAAGTAAHCPCSVTFPAGLDGTYQVYVQGSQGHVIWDA